MSSHWLYGWLPSWIPLTLLMFVSLVGRQPVDCKLITGTILQLHTELCQHFAIRWYQLSDSWNLFVLLIGLHNNGKTGKFYTHHAHFPSILCVVLCMHRPDWMLNENKPINEPSACKDFMDVSQLKLKHVCNVLKSCWTFELEHIFHCIFKLLWSWKQVKIIETEMNVSSKLIKHIIKYSFKDLV